LISLLFAVFLFTCPAICKIVLSFGGGTAGVPNGVGAGGDVLE